MHSYGYIPDIGDQRDKYYRVTKPIELPRIIDLRPMCSIVENQENLGSCTANALVGNLEFLEKKDTGSVNDFSRLFLYYNERDMEGTIGTDSGAMIRDGIKSLVKLGCCHEKNWPYDPDKFTVKPNDECYKEALDHQITQYQRIVSLKQMMNCLATGYPFVFGFTVYESFESDEVARTGIMKMPHFWERTLGGHAVMAVGYDMDKEIMIVRNSWGEGWGDKGYFYMPFKYISNGNLADDFWTISRGEGI